MELRQLRCFVRVVELGDADAAFARAKFKPALVAEIDSLALLMDMVSAGMGHTVQPWAALGRVTDAAQRFPWGRRLPAPGWSITIRDTPIAVRP